MAELVGDPVVYPPCARACQLTPDPCAGDVPTLPFQAKAYADKVSSVSGLVHIEPRAGIAGTRRVNPSKTPLALPVPTAYLGCTSTAPAPRQYRLLPGETHEKAVAYPQVGRL